MAGLGAFGACSGGGDDTSSDRAKGPTPSSSTTSTTTKPVALTAEQLAPALLQLADMPTGWSVLPDEVLDEASDTEGHCNGPNPPARAQTAGPYAYVSAGYWSTTSSVPVVASAIFGFATVDAAKNFMAATQEGISACTTYTEPDDPGSGDISISAVNYPKMGDDMIALRETQAELSPSTFVFTADSVYVRKGNVVALLFEFGVPPIDSTRLQQLVSKQVSNLDELGV